MRSYEFILSGARLSALSSGALWWSETGILVVSDLHFGKSLRAARQGGAMLPPYENRDTLERLERDILKQNPAIVICLGDSFDALQAADEMEPAEQSWLTCLMAGRQWIWIEGNHDPGPVGLGGAHMAVLRQGPLSFRHIADPDASGEISGHFHPKTRISVKGRNLSRPCFLIDETRVILPAYGTFTGGLRSDAEILQELMGPDSVAVLTGKKAQPVPMHL